MQDDAGLSSPDADGAAAVLAEAGVVLILLLNSRSGACRLLFFGSVPLTSSLGVVCTGCGHSRVSLCLLFVVGAGLLFCS